jgi:hypothetical protein
MADVATEVPTAEPRPEVVAPMSPRPHPDAREPEPEAPVPVVVVLGLGSLGDALPLVTLCNAVGSWTERTGTPLRFHVVGAWRRS